MVRNTDLDRYLFRIQIKDGALSENKARCDNRLYDIPIEDFNLGFNVQCSILRAGKQGLEAKADDDKKKAIASEFMQRTNNVQKFITITSEPPDFKQYAQSYSTKQIMKYFFTKYEQDMYEKSQADKQVDVVETDDVGTDDIPEAPGDADKFYSFAAIV